MRKTLSIILLLCFNKIYGQVNDLPKGSVGYFLTKAVEMTSNKKYEAGLRFTDSALSVAGENENIFAVKAEILWTMQRFAEAAEYFQKALLFDKDSSYLFGSYLLLGILFDKADMPVQAQKQYLKAVYFFEKKKRNNDKYFEVPNKIDYAIALRLSGNDEAWERLLDDPFYKSLRDVYFGKSRKEVIEIYFKPFSGG